MFFNAQTHQWWIIPQKQTVSAHEIRRTQETTKDLPEDWEAPRTYQHCISVVFPNYPLVMTNMAIWIIAIEIVDFPMKNSDVPQLC